MQKRQREMPWKVGRHVGLVFGSKPAPGEHAKGRRLIRRQGRVGACGWSTAAASMAIGGAIPYPDLYPTIA